MLPCGPDHFFVLCYNVGMDKKDSLSRRNIDGIENFDDGGMTFRQSPVDEDFKDKGSDGDVKIYNRENGPKHLQDQMRGRNALGAVSFMDKLKMFGGKIRAAFEKITALSEDAKIVKDSSVAILGKDLLGKKDEVCEDTAFVDAENGIFAVFDGVGGSDRAAEASKMAKDGMGDFVADRVPKNSGDLEQILTALSRRISRVKGVTTAVAGRIGVRDGKRVLDYAAAGDSRIYRIRGNKATQITNDEVIFNESTIYNGLGHPNYKMRQTGTILLKKGDWILFCSDGVTGDKKEEQMSNEEIAKIFQSKKTARMIAHTLVQKAKKIDDRTALVVQVK